MSTADFWQRCPTARPRLSHRQVDSDKVVLNLDTGAFFTLNEVAAFLWDRIDGRRTAAQLAEQVVAEYDVAESVARPDVQELLEHLEREGLIDLRDAPAQPR